MAKKQITAQDVTTTERIIFASSAVVILVSLLYLQMLIYSFSGLFIVVLILDLVVLIGVKPTGMAKRLLLLASIFGALFAALFAINAYFPGLLKF